MPISIKLKENLYCPVVICDYCGREITDAKDGNYLYRLDEKARPMEGIYFTHKRCNRAFEMQIPNRWGVNELQAFMVFLSNNIDLDWKRSKKMVEAWVGI